MSNLKPCPFCGSTDIDSEPNTDTYGSVCCNKCGFGSPYGEISIMIEHWNSRPIEDALRTRIAELDGFLCLGEQLDHLLECYGESDEPMTKGAEAIRDWMQEHVIKPKQRTAELESLKCSCCNDPITTDDDDSNLCGACADSLKAELDRWKADNSALKSSAIVWHKYPDEKPDMDVKCLVMFDDGEPIISSFDGFYWWDIEKTWVNRITHWAYLPAPPEEAK
jgi:Lar family restriction alleviation protein